MRWALLLPILATAGLMPAAPASQAQTSHAQTSRDQTATTPASPTSNSPDACFDVAERSNTLALNDHTILVRVNGRVYDIQTQKCPELGSPAPTIDFIAPGSTFVCGRLDYRLLVSELGIPERTFPCFVQSQRRLTPAEVQALPPNDRP